MEERHHEVDAVDHSCRADRDACPAADGGRQDSDDERRSFYEEMWSSPGFRKLTSNYTDMVFNPEANAGNGGFSSVIVTIIYYLGFTIAALFLFSLKDAAHLTDNIVYNIAVASGLGRNGGLAASLAVILSSIATLETTMLQFSRTLFAMGRDGAMPRLFGKVSAKTQSPTQFTETIRRDHPGQAIEHRKPMRFVPSESQAADIEEALKIAMEEDGAMSRTEALWAVCLDYRSGRILDREIKIVRETIQ